MTITFNNFEIFLLIIVRISAFIFTGPIFSMREIPRKVKAGLALFITIIIASNIPISYVEYDGIFAYAALVIKEVVAGAVMGYFTNVSYYILSFVGHNIDQGVGFSMANILDPVSKVQMTVSGKLYGDMIILIMLITNLHHYFLLAIIDSFKIIQLGNVNIDSNIYKLMTEFIVNYFIIGFRISLSIFASILLLNIILAILAKIAPEMNLFAIGIQMKIIIGLVILTFMIGYIPSVADFIFNEMIRMLKASIEYLASR